MMKKRDFISLIAYTVSLLILALGICLYTLPEWGIPSLGMPLSIAGLILVLLSWLLHRRLAGKGNRTLDTKLVAKVVYSVFALLVFGGGFALVATGNMVVGLVVSLLGLVCIIGMIPVTIGLKK